MNALKRAVSILTADTPETVTWDQLVDVEPRLEELRRLVAADSDRSWQAYEDYKETMVQLVGREADEDGLPDWMLTPAAYDVANDAILGPHW